jgi:sortase A
MHKYSYGKNKKFPRKIKKIVGILSIAMGIVCLLYFFFPLISYHLYLSSAFAGSDVQAPLPQRFVLNGNAPVRSLFSTGISNVTSDYKDARNWFPQVKKDPRESDQKVLEYQLSIPSQGISHMKVSTTDFDLSKHLVQYFSTSKSPIDHGTSVIFGHSTLPQWFDPKSYMAVFAHMHLIKDGDEIVLTVNGQDYHYKVFSRTITDSTDPNIFSQSFDNSYITIITCTPPGTTWKRLVVRASLQS